MIILVLIGMVFMFHVPWEDSVLLMLLVNFLNGFRLKLMYISLIVSVRSNLIHLHGFLAACAAVIVHRNHFFCLYQQNESSESKVKLRQASSNHCKRALEAAKLDYATKTNQSITLQKLGSWDFWQIVNSVLNKVKSAIPSLFNSPE